MSPMNLSAPALVSANHMPAIMHVAGYFMSTSEKNLGLALMPVYSLHPQLPVERGGSCDGMDFPNWCPL